MLRMKSRQKICPASLKPIGISESGNGRKINMTGEKALGIETRGWTKVIGNLDASKVVVAETTIGSITTTTVGATLTTMVMPFNMALEQTTRIGTAIRGISQVVSLANHRIP